MTLRILDPCRWWFFICMATTYPFAAIPNSIIRGGHGPINVHVLAYVVSRGDAFASVATMAKEIGCSQRSVRNALKYWDAHASQHGIRFFKKQRGGRSTIYRVTVEKIVDIGVDDSGTPIKNDRGGLSKTTGVPLSKTTDEEEPSEEEPMKKNPYSENSVFLKSSWTSIGNELKKKKRVCRTP